MSMLQTWKGAPAWIARVMDILLLGGLLTLDLAQMALLDHLD